MEANKIEEKLEFLIGSRNTIEELEQKLLNKFEEKIEVAEYEREECVKKDLPDLDEQLMFTIESEDVDVDLYYLTDNGGKYYITEICVN